MPQPTACCNGRAGDDHQPADLQRGNGSSPCYSIETTWHHGVCTCMWNLHSTYTLSYHHFFHHLSPFEPDDVDCCCSCCCWLLINTSMLLANELVAARAKSTRSICCSAATFCCWLCLHRWTLGCQRMKWVGNDGKSIYVYMIPFTFKDSQKYETLHMTLLFVPWPWSQQHGVPEVHTCIYTCGRFPEYILNAGGITTHSTRNMNKVTNMYT